MSEGILQPDGTYCYSGDTCRKHGLKNRISSLESNIKSLLSVNLDTELAGESEVTIDVLNIIEEWADNSEWVIKDLLKEVEVLKETGLSGVVTIPTWNKEAIRAGLIEVKTDDNGTTLLIDPPKLWHSKNRRRITVWLNENGKTTAMLCLLISPKEQKDYWGEAVITSIEVPAALRGKGYSSKIIQLTEKYIINEKLHSGGHYTPEGYKALNGKLPYTKTALYEEKHSRKNGGFNEGIGIHFESMTFIHDWDKFQMER